MAVHQSAIFLNESRAIESKGAGERALLLMNA
jgi:hypothetical protein